MRDVEQELKQAILEFFREELRHRYDLDNVRRFEVFDSIPDAQVDALRSFFLEQVYPPAERRQQLDAAFDHLGGVMHSPRRLRPLMGTAVRSMFRLGRRFPAAVSAGLATIDAYRETRVLEGLMLENAVKMELSLKETRNRERMLRLLTDVPDKVVTRLIEDILGLFRALSNVRILQTAVTFMEVCQGVIQERPDLYTQEDLDGFTLGLEVIQEGLELFQHLAPEQFDDIIEGIESVELEWYHAVKSEAAAEA